MNDSDADQIITTYETDPNTGDRIEKKFAFVYPNNPYFNTLKNNYPDYYEEGCDCMIFPYDVWKSITV